MDGWGTWVMVSVKSGAALRPPERSESETR